MFFRSLHRLRSRSPFGEHERHVLELLDWKSFVILVYLGDVDWPRTQVGSRCRALMGQSEIIRRDCNDYECDYQRADTIQILGHFNLLLVGKKPRLIPHQSM